MSLSKDIHSKTIARSAGDSIGNGLFALTDIEKGAEVLRIDNPFVAVLDTPRLQDTCAGCYGIRQLLQQEQVPETVASVELKACTRCKVVRYCDKSCQLKDWRFAHSLECAIYSKLYPNILPNHARAVLRIILRQQSKKYNSEEFESFLKLNTHEEKISQKNSNDERWNDDIRLSAKAVKEYSGVDLDEDYIASIFARLDINAFNLATPFYDRVGLYLHPYSALINHSCDYNAVVGFEGEKIFVKSTRPIKKEEQLYISYIDTTYCSATRRKQLAERYFFDCRCSKCEEELKKPTAEISSIETAESMGENLIKLASEVEDYDNAIKKYQQGIRTLQSSFAFPITRQPYVSLRNELILTFLSAQRFADALVQSMVRHLKVDPYIYSNAGHPMRRLHAWTLAKLGIYLSQGFESAGAGEESLLLLQKFEINIAFITWSVLAWLVDGEKEACTAPAFQHVVRSKYQQVFQEFAASGLNPANMTDIVEQEWKKVEKLVEHVLQQERHKRHAAAITM